MNPQQTGKRIHQLRKERGWTQKDIAEKLSVTDKAVSKWERGLNYPDMALLEPIARTLDTTVVYLLGIEDMSAEGKVEAVAAVAADETERLRKELRERALYGIFMSILIFATLIYLGHMLIERGVYDWPLRLCKGCLSIVGFHIGNYLWIWWKHRKA